VESDVVVLVVDDEEDLVEILVSALAMKNIKTLTAKNGIEAYNVWKNNPGIKLLLSDIRMPGQDADGISLTKKIREKSSLPIILITGYSDVSHEEAKVFGANIVLSKPFDLMNLLKVIDSYLEVA